MSKCSFQRGSAWPGQEQQFSKNPELFKKAVLKILNHVQTITNLDLSYPQLHTN